MRCLQRHLHLFALGEKALKAPERERLRIVLCRPPPPRSAPRRLLSCPAPSRGTQNPPGSKIGRPRSRPTFKHTPFHCLVCVYVIFLLGSQGKGSESLVQGCPSTIQVLCLWPRSDRWASLAASPVLPGDMYTDWGRWAPSGPSGAQAGKLSCGHPVK